MALNQRGKIFRPKSRKIYSPYSLNLDFKEKLERVNARKTFGLLVVSREGWCVYMYVFIGVLKRELKVPLCL